jgi:uncharacterized LabA/DUF88 family protein
MRSQCAVYVDAGYLLAASATRVTGTSLRSSVDVDHGALIEAVIDQAERDSGLPLLRVNWYDSGARPGGLPDHTQESIGLMPKVKLRLGRKSWSGEQKGVDLRIGLDLATHARHRVVDVMYLVSGDDDLTEAVEEAQSHGIQVTLLVVPNHAGKAIAVAKHLHRAADGLILLDDAAVSRTVRSRSIPEELLATLPEEQSEVIVEPDPEVRPAVEPGTAAITPNVFASKRSTTVIAPQPSAAASAGPVGSGEVSASDVEIVVHQVIDGWCQTATPETLAALRAGRPFIPGELDRAMLMDLSTRADVYDITEQTRHALRDRFWALLDKVRLG